MRSACLYVNSGSRIGRAWFESARLELERHGLAVSEAQVGKVGRLFESVRAAVGRGEEHIVVGGGDGTLSAIAPLLVDSKSILGVLPLGTGNALARDLGIPGDLPGACGVIARGAVRTIDVGFIGDQSFLNVATIGLSTQIARQLDPDSKRTWGKVAYVAAFLRGLRLLRPFQVELVLEGKSYVFQSLQVVIGNGRYHGGPFLLAPDADIDTGFLEVYGLASGKKGSLWDFAWKLLRGRQSELENVIASRVQGGHIQTRPRQRVTIDGEKGPRTPARFGIRPRALSVYAAERNGPKSAVNGCNGNEGNL